VKTTATAVAEVSSSQGDEIPSGEGRMAVNELAYPSAKAKTFHQKKP